MLFLLKGGYTVPRSSLKKRKGVTLQVQGTGSIEFIPESEEGDVIVGHSADNPNHKYCVHFDENDIATEVTRM